MSEERMCPRCQETRQIEVLQHGWTWCGICCCPFRWPWAAAHLPGGPARDDEAGLSPACREATARRGSG
jgi:hypothetical protein